jgi:hypothetical protein
MEEDGPKPNATCWENCQDQWECCENRPISIPTHPDPSIVPEHINAEPISKVHIPSHIDTISNDISPMGKAVCNVLNVEHQ